MSVALPADTRRSLGRDDCIRQGAPAAAVSRPYSRSVLGERRGDPMSFRRLCRTALLAAPSLFVAVPASAHHVMGGKLPSTWVEGLLSGLAHPMIGPDHLGFLLAVAVVVGACGLSLALPGVFVAAMAAGVGLQVLGTPLPATGAPGCALDARCRMLDRACAPVARSSHGRTLFCSGRFLSRLCIR
jgi:hypothetical protein